MSHSYPCTLSVPLTNGIVHPRDSRLKHSIIFYGAGNNNSVIYRELQKVYMHSVNPETRIRGGGLLGSAAPSRTPPPPTPTPPTSGIVWGGKPGYGTLFWSRLIIFN